MPSSTSPCGADGADRKRSGPEGGRKNGAGAGRFPSPFGRGRRAKRSQVRGFIEQDFENPVPLVGRGQSRLRTSNEPSILLPTKETTMKKRILVATLALSAIALASCGGATDTDDAAAATSAAPTNAIETTEAPEVISVKRMCQLARRKPL